MIQSIISGNHHHKVRQNSENKSHTNRVGGQYDARSHRITARYQARISACWHSMLLLTAYDVTTQQYTIPFARYVQHRPYCRTYVLTHGNCSNRHATFLYAHSLQHAAVLAASFNKVPAAAPHETSTRPQQPLKQHPFPVHARAANCSSASRFFQPGTLAYRQTTNGDISNLNNAPLPVCALAAQVQQAASLNQVPSEAQMVTAATQKRTPAKVLQDSLAPTAPRHNNWTDLPHSSPLPGPIW
jgi:hypothetical protein